MSKKKPKYLIETSAIPPALGTTTPEYVRHIQTEVEGGTLYTSLYIRKEFLRRWFCDTVRVALTVYQCDTWADALVHLEQAFGRGPKGTLDGVQHYLRQNGTIDNTATAAEEIASLAWRWLKLFDRVFVAKINNVSKCQLGGRIPLVDGNTILQDLYAFYEAFQKPVTDCEVNDFLDLGNPKARARVLFAHAKAKECDSVESLKALADKGKWITCKECGNIGDAVVALEQPASWCLVHVDKAYAALCLALGRENKHIKSLKGAEKIDLDPATKKLPASTGDSPPSTQGQASASPPPSEGEMR